MSAVAMPLRMVIASFGPMPLTVISFSKSCFSSGRRNPIERQRVLTHMGMNVQRNSVPAAGQFGKRRDGDGDVVADAGGLNDGLVGMLRDEPSAKVSNHE